MVIGQMTEDYSVAQCACTAYLTLAPCQSSIDNRKGDERMVKEKARKEKV